jgi:hypothetical protein
MHGPPEEGARDSTELSGGSPLIDGMENLSNHISEQVEHCEERMAAAMVPSRRYSRLQYWI